MCDQCKPLQCCVLAKTQSVQNLRSSHSFEDVRMHPSVSGGRGHFPQPRRILAGPRSQLTREGQAVGVERSNQGYGEGRHASGWLISDGTVIPACNVVQKLGVMNEANPGGCQRGTFDALMSVLLTSLSLAQSKLEPAFQDRGPSACTHLQRRQFDNFVFLDFQAHFLQDKISCQRA
jgi:hypothetical protein